MNARDLPRAIHEAFRTAQEGRPGPVLIDVPRDVQLEEADVEFPEAWTASPATLSEDILERVRQAARMINEAERPVIIGGHGNR